LNQKAKSLFHDRKRPAKIAWTVQFRKAHKKVTLKRKQCHDCSSRMVGQH